MASSSMFTGVDKDGPIMHNGAAATGTLGTKFGWDARSLQKDLAPVLAELYAREKQGMALVEDLEMAEDALREAEKGYDVAYVEGRFEDAERHKQTIIEQEQKVRDLKQQLDAYLWHQDGSKLAGNRGDHANPPHAPPAVSGLLPLSSAAESKAPSTLTKRTLRAEPGVDASGMPRSDDDAA